jgi:anti-sigma regulatory factor (Ser/Thr protein kinase)
VSVTTDVVRSTESHTADALAVATRGLREKVVGFAASYGVSGEALSDLRLATSEAITNAVEHAYPDQVTPGTVTVRIDIDDSGASVTVTDQGVGTTTCPGSARAGLGFAVIDRVSDATSVESGHGEGGTDVTFTSTRWAAVHPRRTAHQPAEVALCSQCLQAVDRQIAVPARSPGRATERLCLGCYKQRLHTIGIGLVGSSLLR